MDLRRKETKLTVIMSAASDSRRGRHAVSYSVGEYYHNPCSVTTQRASALAWTSGVSYGDTPRADAWNQGRSLPPATLPPCRAQRQQPTPGSTGASTSHLPNPTSTVFLLDRSAPAEPPASLNGKSSLRRKAHIRRGRGRPVSEGAVKIEAVIAPPVSPDALDKNEALTPLMESVAEMYSGPLRRASSYTYTVSSPSLEEDLDSPSVYSVYMGDDDDDERPHEEEVFHQPFSFLHDWANGIHDRDAKMHEDPEGKLLPKRVATVQLKALLRRRRDEAGLADGVPESPDDY